MSEMCSWRWAGSEEAVVAYKHALRSKPDYAEAHNILGVALKELGKLDEAQAAYEQRFASRRIIWKHIVILGSVLMDQGNWT